MRPAATISPAIVETLYEDALLLAEEARLAFDCTREVAPLSEELCERRVAMSCEALRTTTRMMHAIAWLLNHRAYFAGELSEFQLRRHGRLPPPQGESDPAQLLLLDYRTRDVIERSRAFYARVTRLDRAWRERFEMRPAAVHRLRERLDVAFSGLAVGASR